MPFRSPYEQADIFCQKIYSKAKEEDKIPQSKPLVTLTFAQTLDAKISAAKNAKTKLSCEESMILTHHLRTIHDGILVGVGTILIDNPRLNEPSLLSTVNNPIPIILDTNLRIPTDAKILHYHKTDSAAKAPIVVCGPSNAHSQKKKEVEGCGARVICIDPSECDAEGRPLIPSILKALKSVGIKSVMVEGGANVIGSFLDCSASSGVPIVDVLIVTISPKIIGSRGTGASDQATLASHPSGLDLKDPVYEQFGTDIICASVLAP
ncbi:hypothetical protein BB560_005865 [Smittium megazygosporum]|uniref:2,5-diamino-6-ribosylamino-4(3H)-pyrimidinone 5'-phosphate reductase n=1 Tax=Smittium megazygosporum TaxID=133381 RepID=A0A2T9YSN6_9FUNG|nr:hypothetical protein BB560_005865 [Smittium megazygosporum]